ncbi:Protein of uncharacterised function (DUF3046) [Mycobacterium tuberculosis]|nr:Protein of uncharacterised function (DUF3046) [Mycobacterium tuberculosis]
MAGSSVTANRPIPVNRHVLTGFDGRSAAQAIEDGVEPRDVWRALCADFDVPHDRW